MRLNKKYLLIGGVAVAAAYLYSKSKGEKASAEDTPGTQTQTPAPASPTPTTPNTVKDQPVAEKKSNPVNVLPARQHEITAIAIAVKNKFYYGTIIPPDRDYITRQINALKSTAEAQYLASEFKRVSGKSLGKEIARFFTPAQLEKINASYKNQL